MSVITRRRRRKPGSIRENTLNYSMRLRVDKILTKIRTKFNPKFPPDRFIKDILPTIPLQNLDCSEKLFAVMTDGKHNISTYGFNHSRTYLCGKKCTSIHAEEHCILKLLSMFSMRDLVKKNRVGTWYSFGTIRNTFKKFNLFVFRINSEGEYVYSKPCKSCMSLMNAINLRNMSYTDFNGDTINVRLNTEDIETYGFSCGPRHLREYL